MELLLQDLAEGVDILNLVARALAGYYDVSHDEFWNTVKENL